METMKIDICYTNGEFTRIYNVDKFSIDGGNIKVHSFIEGELGKANTNYVFSLDKIAGYIIKQETIFDKDEEHHKIDNWGHWVPIDDEPHEEWECDRCGYTEYAEVNDYVYNSLPNYCPHCGAAMFSELLEENEDEKDKEEN